MSICAGIDSGCLSILRAVRTVPESPPLCPWMSLSHPGLTGPPLAIVFVLSIIVMPNLAVSLVQAIAVLPALAIQVVLALRFPLERYSL